MVCTSIWGKTWVRLFEYFLRTCFQRIKNMPSCQIWMSEVWRYHSSSSAQDVEPKKFDWSRDPNIPRNGCSRLLTCPTVVSFPLSRKMVFASPPPPTTRPGDWSTWGVALGFGSFCCYCWANKQTTDELVSKPRFFRHYIVTNEQTQGYRQPRGCVSMGGF